MTFNPHTDQLGNLRSDHRPTVGGWILIVMGVTFTGSALLFFGFGLRSNQSAADLEARVFFDVIMLVLGLGPLYIAYRHFNQRAQVFEQGLVFRRDATTYVWRWEEIAYVWQQITKVRVNFVPVRTVYLYTLQHRDGRKIKLTSNLRGIKLLGETVQNETFKRLMPLALAAYNRGETLNFGKLQLSQAGMSNGKETLPWVQIKGVAVNQGYISVQKEGKWLRWSNAAVAKTPNFYIFMELVNRISGQR